MLIQRIHDLITFMARQEQSGYISPEKKDRAINAASSELFTDEIKKLDATGRISEHLRPMKAVASVSLTSGAGSLPGDFSRELSVTTTISSNKYKGYLVGDDQFESNEWAEFISNRPELDHLIKKEMSFSNYSVPVSLPKNLRKATGLVSIVGSNHFEGLILSDELWPRRGIEMCLDKEGRVDFYFKNTADITLTDGIGTLPAHFVKEIDFCSVVDGPPRLEYEGEILNDNKFEEAKSDTVYPRSLEHPIARVYGDSIEVYPSSIAKIKLHFIQYPTLKRPIARLVDDKLEVLPLTTTGKLLYVQFPTDKAFAARVTGSQIEVNPDTLSSVSLTYLKKPTVGVYGYTVAGDGRSFVFSSGDSTDLDWSDVSFKELSIRSLKYLGIPLREELLVQFGLQDKAMK